MSKLSNATNSEATLENILVQVRVLKKEYGMWTKSTGENFNVFSILHMERYEVETHSAIIAELLNPQGSHSQGALFLKLFLDKFQEEQKEQKKLDGLRKKLKQIQKDDYDKFKVRVETSFKVKVATSQEDEKRGRIDILIESDGINSGDVFIVIENKIYAGDQEEQLDKYHKHASVTGKEPGIIYLTLLRDEPSKYGSGEISLDEVVFLSYEESIDEWLGACIKEVARIPQIRETLHQYQITVKKLTGHPINRRYAMALKNILLEDKNFDLIPDLEAALSEAKVAFQCDFWTKLKEELKAREELKDTRYEVYKGQLGTEEKDGPEECIDECAYRGGLGLTSSFSKNENYEIVFRIAHERYLLYYGFVLCKKGGREKVAIDETKHGKYLAQYSIANGKNDSWKSGWLTYKYFNNPEINFTDFTFVTNRKEPKREDFIKELVENLVTEIERNL